MRCSNVRPLPTPPPPPSPGARPGESSGRERKLRSGPPAPGKLFLAGLLPPAAGGAQEGAQRDSNAAADDLGLLPGAYPAGHELAVSIRTWPGPIHGAANPGWWWRSERGHKRGWLTGRHVLRPGREPLLPQWRARFPAGASGAAAVPCRPRSPRPAVRGTTGITFPPMAPFCLIRARVRTSSRPARPATIPTAGPAALTTALMRGGGSRGSRRVGEQRSGTVEDGARPGPAISPDAAPGRPDGARRSRV